MRRYLITTCLLLLGLLSGVVLAACGGDSAPETPIVVTDTTQSLSKAEFIAQADAICEQANTQIADIAAAGGGITQAAEVAQIRQQMATDIRDLGTPSDEGTSSPTSTSSSLGTDTGTSTAAPEDTSTFPEGPSTTAGVGTDTGTSTGTDTSATGTGTSTGPATTGDPLQDFLSAIDAAVKAGEKIDLANQRGESTAEGEAELADAKDQASTAAAEYGFEQCGQEGTTSGTSTTSTSGTSGTAVPSAPSTGAPSTGAPSTGAPSSGDSSPGSSGSSGGVSGGGGVGPG